jgi:RNA polymerase sigma factor (sigma-70 family)
MDEARIVETLPSVRQLARFFSRKFPADADELLSVGHEAVVHADREFDAARGVKFASFAWMRARYAMLEYVRREAIRHSRRPLSLDGTASVAEDVTLAEVVHDRSSEVVLDARALLRLLARLPERQKDVITRHIRGESNDEIARALRVSPGRVGQLMAQGFDRLKAEGELPVEPADVLHERELEVLELAALGYSCNLTAQDLYLSSETVKTYRQRVIRKLGARNITHAVAVAFASGVLRPGSLNGLKSGV